MFVPSHSGKIRDFPYNISASYSHSIEVVIEECLIMEILSVPGGTTWERGSEGREVTWDPRGSFYNFLRSIRDV